MSEFREQIQAVQLSLARARGMLQKLEKTCGLTTADYQRKSEQDLAGIWPRPTMITNPGHVDEGRWTPSQRLMREAAGIAVAPPPVDESELTVDQKHQREFAQLNVRHEPVLSKPAAINEAHRRLEILLQAQQTAQAAHDRRVLLDLGSGPKLVSCSELWSMVQAAEGAVRDLAPA